MILSGWGRFPVKECQVAVLRDAGDIEPIFARAPSLIARGSGRAYGDAAINTETTLLMNAEDRILAFDAQIGNIECQAGVVLCDIITVALRGGWFAPVVPGTKFVTVGGLIAADVHGKNHHVDGSFGRHVESLRLALADGSIVSCSPTENGELFAATLGGMGLTGVILSARIKLRKVQSPDINETVIRAPSLESLLELFDQHHAASYSVAWIDCLSSGREFGRGVLMLGEHAEVDADTRSIAFLRANTEQPGFSVPFTLPVSPLNRWSIKAFNELYYRLQKTGKRRTHYDRFFFPLDAVQNWNRIYGRHGFVQYQCVIGGSDARQGLRRILELVKDMSSGSFLAVLKKLGPGHRFLSFPKEGYTITLDFPVRAPIMDGLAKFDAVLAEHDGRIYLAKDARAPREVIERGYPDIDAFRELRRKIDPARKLRSALSERLGL